MTRSHEARSHDMLGMRLDHVTPEDAVKTVIDRAVRGKGGYCCVPNVHMCIEAVDDPAFKAVVNNAALTWSDSTILNKARSWRHGETMPRVIKGAEMMQVLVKEAARNDLPVGLYGASEETIERLRTRLPALADKLQLVYAFSPPFRALSQSEDDAIIAEIRKMGVKLLFIGLGCPKQERWMADHAQRLPDTMMIGVGAAFDFNAGTVPPSPDWVHKYGVEWLYRLISEPKRLARRYLTTSPRFVGLLAWDYLRNR